MTLADSLALQAKNLALEYLSSRLWPPSLNMLSTSISPIWKPPDFHLNQLRCYICKWHVEYSICRKPYWYFSFNQSNPYKRKIIYWLWWTAVCYLGLLHYNRMDFHKIILESVSLNVINKLKVLDTKFQNLVVCFLVFWVL